jgi:hypothetical protein
MYMYVIEAKFWLLYCTHMMVGYKIQKTAFREILNITEYLIHIAYLKKSQLFGTQNIFLH